MIIACWGDEKTCKTSFGLTFPAPIAHFDIDLGYERVAYRFKGKDIRSKSYPIPLQIPGQKLEGIKELWLQFQKDYYQAAMDAEVATLVVDSGTQLYEINRLAFLQERQESQLKRGLKPNESLRESLLPVEYAEPFARMDSIYYVAKAKNKHLVVTHFSRDERMDRLNPATGQIESVTTGKMELDGYKRTERQVDLVLHTFTRKPSDPKNKNTVPVPYGIVLLSGLHLGMVGQELVEPNYEKLVDMLKMLRGEA